MLIENFKINYRKKIYHTNDLKLTHFALISNKGIILSRKSENIKKKETISSTYHNFKSKIDYNNSFNIIKDNEKYMITKHEYNRLFKLFKNEFTNNCLV